MHLLQSAEKLSAKHGCDGGFRKKETFVPRLHKLTSRCNATAGDTDVDVWMEVQLLSPGMKYADDTRFCTHKFAVGTESKQCILNAPEQKPQEFLLVIPDKRIQFMWDCENNVVVCNPFNQFRVPLRLPLFGERCLTA